jgi:carbon starvation protein CstA
MGGGNSTSVYTICSETMGGIGIILAMLGVIACPITSGDTAFRSARLTLSDWFKIDQESYANRLKLCIPLLGIGAFLGFGQSFGLINYNVIWNYFSWSNQTLAMIVLWAGSMYLAKEKKNFWIGAVPAAFMSAVTCTYFMMAPECLGMIPFLNDNHMVAYPVGLLFAAVCLWKFLSTAKKYA